MPMPERFLTSMMARLNGRLLLIDCGEGTQVAIKKFGWGFKNIDVICFTHYHADHISGLTGMLLTMANSGRTEPLVMIGPPGLAYIVDGMLRICPELPFQLEFKEVLDKNPSKPVKAGAFEISCAWAEHTIYCLSYRLDIRRRGRFLVDKAQALGLPKALWGKLQKLGSVEHEGISISSELVTGKPRKGISVAYCTDSRPNENIEKLISGVDLFICEGMYGEDDKLDKARENRHMLFSEAARLAAGAQAGQLWLTHFSPSLTEPELYIENARNIFPNTSLGEDGKTVTLQFQE